ncbi:hypothetical protein OGM63_05670 [Plectonema radiosum NIES-515]|uniref:Uncharacterized protein n=1 Tax=Plectonema radiosum NIES-515 TaxID=2986073 RepID=A0ABT3AV72_9CYAN|nr:hypothetical protein [Plectonema radiosum]MCV3213019.1 hypothetical protein [Plectonema radiosum NIES-515]
MKNNLDIILGLAALVVVIYRVFQVEAAIYDAIENTKDSFNNRINSLEHNLALHVAIYAERKEQVDYLLHNLDSKIEHKFNRLLEEIKQLKLEQKYKNNDEN